MIYMKKKVMLIAAIVITLGMLTSCKDSDSSSSKDESTAAKDKNIALDSDEAKKIGESGKKIAKAAIGIGAIALDPAMSGYVNKAQQAAADAGAKELYKIIEESINAIEAEGKSLETKCDNKKVSVSELKDSTELEKLIYSKLSKIEDIDKSNILFEIRDGKVIRTKWQKSEDLPIGNFPKK